MTGMEYFGSSPSGSKKSGTPFLSGMPLSIIRPAFPPVPTHLYNGMAVQEIVNLVLKSH